MEDEKKTKKYLKGYDAIGPIEKVFNELKKHCEKHNVDFEVAAKKLGEAIQAQCRSATAEQHFLEYWTHLARMRPSLLQ
tara:strand:- start:553 stop:789 length:237 start_codon:yes stop_codon:yes gene_type:complete